MVIQRFCRAYMESPPPAVFHYKYQSYKYERNTAGKSARGTPAYAVAGNKELFATGCQGYILVVKLFFRHIGG